MLLWSNYKNQRVTFGLIFFTYFSNPAILRLPQNVQAGVQIPLTYQTM